MKHLLGFLLILSMGTPTLTLAQPTYVGSKKCMSCHASIYNMWKDTLHNKSQQIQSRTNDTLVVDALTVTILMEGPVRPN